MDDLCFAIALLLLLWLCLAPSPTPNMAEQQKAASTRPVLSPLTSTPRKLTPSPLQVSHVSTPLVDSFVHASPKDLASPTSSKGPLANSSSFSPRSPHYSPVFLVDTNDSSGNGGEFLRPPMSRTSTNESATFDVNQNRRTSPLATPRGNDQPATRDFSVPSNSSAITTDSPPHSPSNINSTKIRALERRPVERLGPRTSSIDSTMSSVSSTNSYASSDPLSPNPAEVAQMIANAGSAEAAIRQLVKDKKQSAAQNAQLWRLINKQRTLLIGLNADLARAMEDKEKYQRRYKDLSATVRPQQVQRVKEVRKDSPSGASVSPGVSDDELPIQRHSVVETNVEKEMENETTFPATPDLPNSTPENRMTTILNPVHAISQVSSSNTSPSLSSEGMPKAPTESENSDTDDDEEDDSRRRTIMQAQFGPIAPLEIHKRMPPKLDPAISVLSSPLQDVDSGPSPSSFSARRSITTPRKSAHNSPHISGDSPVEGPGATSPVLRKGPPAPLNLQQKPIQPPQPLSPPGDYPAEAQTQPEQATITLEEPPTFERGRKKTREEDDKEREYIIKKEIESRSQSKKEKRAKSGSKSKPTSVSSKRLETSPTQSLPKSPAIRAFSPNESPTSLQEHLSPHASLASMLSNPGSSTNSIIEQTVTMSSPPLSPGLPRSPRPVDRPLNSPAPRAPAEGHVASPPLSPRPATLSPPILSPRAPRHPIPLPPHTPTSLTSPSHSTKSGERHISTTSSGSRSPALLPAPVMSEQSPRQTEKPPVLPSPRSPKSPQQTLSPRSPKSPTKPISAPLAPTSGNVLSENVLGGIYQGLKSEAHPDLLLAPNALPLITIKVTSSRLRPSRASMLPGKNLDEDPVFTLGITRRVDMKQLWRVEKPIMSLPQLDRDMKQIFPFEFKLPDRNLFSGHAPAKIDARREALEKYFEDVLNTPMNDKAGHTICSFLTASAFPADDHEGGKAGASNENHVQVQLGPDGKPRKEGFLTKRGKNFGGWKARWFVLDEPILRYYESPGGALLGTIKLMNAQIGRQSAHHASQSPSRNPEEHDKEFRHAFLILEPKKKDSSSIVRHVLCAENDEERDEWVMALLQYIGQPAPEPKSKGESKGAQKGILHSMRKAAREESPARLERGRDEAVNTLQGVSYEDTVAGQPVKLGPAKETTSPLASSFNSSQGMMMPPPKAISGPTNGSVISDVGAWGNRPADSPKIKDKEKKRGIFGGFGQKSNDSIPSPSMAAMPSISRPIIPTNGKQVFGMPLAEAVQLFPIRGREDISLPAVVYRCLEYLEAKDAANEEGIFRLSGSNVTIKQLRERFNTEGDVDFLTEGTHYDIHAVASLLKAYLRELPSTIFGSREIHLQFLQVLGESNSSPCIFLFLFSLTIPANRFLYNRARR